MVTAGGDHHVVSAQARVLTDGALDTIWTKEEILFCYSIDMMFMDFKERTLMLSRFFFSMLMLSFMASQVIAAPKQLPQPEFAAMATANALNSFKSVGDYITWLGMVGTKEDLEQVRAELVKLGVDLKAKFPKANYKKDKVYFDKDNFLIYGKDSFTVNGKKVSLNRQSAHQLFVGICAQIGCKKTSAEFSFFSKAHARFNWNAGLAGAAALGGLAYLFGPPGAAGKGALAGLVLGGLFMNRQHGNSCGWFQSNNCGSVSYNNGSCGYTNNGTGNREQIYGPTNQGQCDQLAYDLQTPNSPLGYTGGGTGSGYGDDLGNDLGSAQPTSAGTKDGKAVRGTTSVPKK